ncbi:MAG: polyribonucleotide nucleotidyltransferase, partial [Methylococcales bacterium]
YRDGQYLLNPGWEELETSDLDLVVAGTESAVLMVESEADCLPEDVMLGAVMFGHEQLQVAISVIKELAADVGKPPMEWAPPETNPDLVNLVKSEIGDQVSAAYQIAEKGKRQDTLKALRTELVEKLTADDQYVASDIYAEIEKLEKVIVRTAILRDKKRIDGRALAEIRAISVQTGLLPRAHGSAVFTRGETQAIVATTLGTERDAQIIDGLDHDYKDQFMLHYNFPPFCVGETGFVGSPKRREIGHGRLAKRATKAVLPDLEEFSYTLRVVSEITESNGSSSMASVCGTSLSLMDAGVPIKAPVSGIAMGLIKEGDEFAVLSDIMGDEDHLGDMDFKVAGTADGLTALQMDIKIDGITKQNMQSALDQAREGRMHILSKMNEVIKTHNEDMSDFAPRIETFSIDPSKIRDVIGKGGATIRNITEQTGVSIDISDDGVIKIASVDKEAGQAAKSMVEDLTADVEVGKIYEGRVARIMDFGAFVNIMPGKDGLVHISQISHDRVEKVEDQLSENDLVKVKVLEIDRQGRVRLSMKAVDDEAEDEASVE